MLQIILTTIILTTVLWPNNCGAQGTLYLSNLGDGSSGSVAVANNAWAAELFETGFNYPNGYTLDSVQLLMSGSSGNPSSFSVSIYQPNRFNILGNIVGNLMGPDPTSAGVFTYAPTSTIELSPSEVYYIVVTAVTTSTDGVYFWNQADSYNYSTALWPDSHGTYISSDGVSWTSAGFPFQFAIYATLTPEPSAATLVLLGSGLLIYVSRRKT